MKISETLFVTLLLFFYSAYAGHDYTIKFNNYSDSTITITPDSHNCLHGYSNKAIVIAKKHSSNIKIKANNSGNCAFEDTQEEVKFSSGNSSLGWINFSMAAGHNNSNTSSSGNVFNNGLYGQDFVNRWTFYSDADVLTTVTFW